MGKCVNYDSRGNRKTRKAYGQKEKTLFAGMVVL